MCARLLRLKPFIREIASKDDFPELVDLNDYQWAFLDALVTVLERFMIAQKLLEGEKYVTASIILTCITRLKQHLKDVQVSPDYDVHMKAIAKVMEVDFEEHWGDGTVPVTELHLHTGFRNRSIGVPLLCLFASYLDIRTKHFEELTIDERKSLVNQLKAWILSTDICDITIENDPPQSNKKSRKKSVYGFFVTRKTTITTTILEEQHQQTGPPQILLRKEDLLEKEMKAYNEVEAVPWYVEDINGRMISSFHDPLLWWQNNKNIFPILSNASTRILSIPAASSPAERTFSGTGQTITADRNRLTGMHVNDEITVRGCMAHGEIDPFTFENSIDLEDVEHKLDLGDY
jgi:hypothetical protein